MSSATRRNWFYDSVRPRITALCYGLLAAALVLILLGSILPSTVWWWSWPVALVLLILSAWREMWGLLFIAVLIMLLPLAAIGLQGI
ncbi:hypothetical protein [Canibacter oris]|uniref:Putative membrane protein YccC n=1 Tax=Canibacter oris TaxID=1365628 RepID=A0A840DJ92_9MICO|nr:hypothetical protein [Canibacter oris]MBB4071783.1 putative membrane protein YccC [Canibacter oris]